MVASAMSRRMFLGSVLGASALAVPLAGRAAASTATLYWLDPDWGAGDPSCVPNQGQATCGGCSACVSHYQNKLFASAAAAEAGRAHPGCKCLVEKAFAVDQPTYDRLFGGGNTSVDRRTPGINEILAGSTAAPAPQGATPIPVVVDPGGSTSSGTLPLTGAAAGPLAAVGAGAVAIGALLRRAGREREDTPSK